jgi:uncharacterized protein
MSLVPLPYYVFTGIDKPSGDAARLEARGRHREHIRRQVGGCRCVLGGPLYDRPGGRMVGSLLVFEAPSEEAVRSFMAADPYIRAGIFESVEIRPWLVGLGRIL